MPPAAPKIIQAISLRKVNIVIVPSIIISPALKIIRKNNNPPANPLTRPFILIILELVNPVTKEDIPHIIVKIISNTVLFRIPVLVITTDVILSNKSRTISPIIRPITIPFIKLNLLNSKVKLFIDKEHPRV